MPALLEALRLPPAAVFGTSLGGVIALCLAVRHPQAVRAAILHEPAFWSLFDHAEEVGRRVAALIEEGMRSGGPPAAFERFYRFAAGEANWENLDPALRERVLAGAETYLRVRARSVCLPAR